MSVARVVAFLAMLAAAVGVRALPWREVFEPGGVVFFGNDAWYHARRIAYGFVHFPEQLGHDPYLAFPEGARAIWAPGFDATLAALARLALGAPEGGASLLAPGAPGAGASLLALERLLVWVPPVLGAATIATAVLVARRLFGRAEAIWTGAVLCVLPAHFWYTRIGFVDHHAAVAFLSTLSVALAVASCGAVRSGRTASAIAWTVGCGAAFASLVWTWTGSVWHVALVDVGVALALGVGRSRAEALRAARSLAGMNAVAALLLAPALWMASPPWSAWSPLVLSRFQPLAFGVVAFAAGACAALWRADAFGATGARRAGSAAIVAVALLALGLGALPELREGLLDAWRWLVRDDPFQPLVGESQPLLVNDGRLSLAIAWRRFGPFVFLYPLALAALAVTARRRPECHVLFWWSAGLFVTTLFQRRFFATASVGFAIVLAVSLCRAWRSVEGDARRRWAVGAATAAALIPLLVPYAGFVANEGRVRRGEALQAGPGFGATRAGVAVADWLRSATPETSGWLARDAEPEYGVLAPWHLGHLITHRGRRPTVVDNFGDDLGVGNFAFARRVFAANAEAAAEALGERRVRFVVVDGDARWLGREGGAGSPGSLVRALFERDGAARGHFRLVTETRGAVFSRPGAPARYKVFERVAGARVAGRAAPGAEVEASVEVRTARGRAFTHRAATIAGDDGVYRLRLPYATRGAPSGVRVAPAYTLRCGGEEGALAVDEEAVQRGREVDGPALCARALTPPRVPADGEREAQESP